MRKGNNGMDDYHDMPRSRETTRDLVVMPNEFAYVSDQTKGNINVHVGPIKTSLAGTDQLVIFNYTTKRFVNAVMDDAIQTFATAPEGWYLVLKNPEKEGKQPAEGRADVPRQLNVGRKVNIPGPTSFALWPGQMIKTVKGHILRSNQYLVVRVYDESSARANWSDSVIKKADGEGSTADDVMGQVDLTMGKLFIIKGTEVSFYIPPTGVEVVAEGEEDAVTLERLEYCILKDENGNKRYVEGPDVVFPEPTEIFLKKEGSRKFKAYELSPISGIYIKVIANYDDHKVGDELFITGKDQMIYFPREEHAIMKYGDKDKHYATAIPAGEARYVLNRLNGTIRLEKGPSMFLPDPREEVLVRRVLTPKDVQTWFPGNIEAIKYNQSLAEAQQNEKDGYVTMDSLETSRGFAQAATAQAYATKQVYDEDWDSRERAVKAKMADALQRNTEYSKPRTVTIDSKYEGAVVIEVWTGYAIKVKSKTNQHKVIVGPACYMLEYDESLEHMELSTGTPKTDNTMMRTAYLRVLNNKVSDVIMAETKDNCRVQVKLSYRVNFEGENDKWFNVENYVKFMTDHMRSLGKALIKGVGIEEFYANPHEIIRDAFLGMSKEGERTGRVFTENGMRIYEVEVLQVKIGDTQIEQMLIQNQNELVKQNLQLAHMARETALVEETEKMNRQKEEAQLVTTLKRISNSVTKINEKKDADLIEKKAQEEVKEAAIQVEKKNQEHFNTVAQAELDRDKAEQDQALAEEQAKLELIIKKFEAEISAVVEKGKAVSPHLIAALQTIGDKQLAAALSQNMSVQAMLGGKSVVEVFQNLLGGDSTLGDIAKKFLTKEKDHEKK